MPIIRLKYRRLSPVDSRNRERPAFLSANLRNSYFPGKGIPFSLLIHAILFCILFFLRAPKDIRGNEHAQERATIIQQNEPRVVMYLPLIGGGTLGMIFPAPKTLKPAQRPSVASTPKPKGLSYPGRQEIISDPPEPTNQIQALEQPALISPPILPPPLLLPNIVQTAEVHVEPLPEIPPSPENIPEQKKPVEPPPVKHPEPPKPKEPPELPKPVEPIPVPVPVIEPEVPAVAPMTLPFPVAPQISIEVPKIMLPPLVPPKQEKPPAPDVQPEKPPALIPRQEPAPKKVLPKEPERASAELPKSKATAPATEKPKELSPAPQDSAARDRGLDQQDLLALSPMPAPLQKTMVVPQGEARGRFAISPEPNLAASEMTLGSKSGVTDAASVIGDRANAPAVNGVPQAESMPTVVDIGSISGSAKSKEAVGANAAKSKPKRKETPGIAGSGTGLSKSGNTGGGSAPGRGAGAGIGSGSGPGKKKPFSGITIVGGYYDPGVAADVAPVVQARRPMQTSYGVTVISTENSGGGLPNMGVFSGEQIYTVYLDMRRDESDPAPSWTLEFAVFRDPSNPENASNQIIRNQEGLILPFPIEKEPPSWPNELISKYRGRQIIVYAIINIEGRMGSISVKNSPDRLLNEPLLQALSKWVFRPAQLNGAPIAVKTLMGIPLWMPE